LLQNQIKALDLGHNYQKKIVEGHGGKIWVEEPTYNDVVIHFMTTRRYKKSVPYLDSKYLLRKLGISYKIELKNI
jgi:hypothetical protein